MAKLVVPVPPNKKSPGNVERPKEKASTVSLLTRGRKPLVLLGLLALFTYRNIRITLDMDEDPRVGAPRSSDNNNDAVVAAAAAAAAGNHNSSFQNEQNKTPLRGSVGSALVSASTTF